MDIIWYGTASLIVNDDKNKILFDPFFTFTDKTDFYRNRYTETFRACDAIVLTHGHFDHIHHVPEIVENTNIPIYCTKNPYDILLRKGVNTEQLNLISIGDTLNINNFEIKVYKGRHANFGLPLILSTISKRRFWKNLPYATKIGMLAAFDEKEAKETVIFEVKNGGKNIIILGSMGYAEKEKYPKNVDMLVLPYQGRSDLPEYSIKLVDIFQPKKVLLDHFNDYCPPISSQVDYSEFLELAKQKDCPCQIIAPEREQVHSV